MIIAYIFTGEEERDEDGDFIVPRDATHVSIDESVTVIPEFLFSEHPNIVELICHDGVIKIEKLAFAMCPRLKRVIMRGVKVIEMGVFQSCIAVTYVECPKLEIIAERALTNCKSLRSIDLTSVKTVSAYAFYRCDLLTNVKFGKNLESLGGAAFYKCISLEQITIPLKDGLFTRYDTFQECANLTRADLAGGDILTETMAALLLEEWRDDINEAIDSIYHLLPYVSAGICGYYDDPGAKALTIQRWIVRVLSKLIDYKAQHRRIVSKAASALQLALPNDIVTNYVVPFLELPPHTFDGEDEDDEEEEIIDDSDDGNEYAAEFDDDGEEEKDLDDSHDQLLDASADGGDDEVQQHQDDEGERKRRKTANDDTERMDD